MRKDLIFDAMDDIDDDMLQEVDALRNTPKKKSYRTWMRYVSMAACLCMLVGGLWIVSRTGLLDRFETEDSVSAELAAGQDLAHSFVSVTVKGEENESVMTDIQDVTAIYDLLQSFSQYSPFYSEIYEENQWQEEEKTSVSAGGQNESVNAEGFLDDKYDSAQYEITLTTQDGREITYLLVGETLKNKVTGEIIALNSQQLQELIALLHVK